MKKIIAALAFAGVTSTALALNITVYNGSDTSAYFANVANSINGISNGSEMAPETKNSYNVTLANGSSFDIRYDNPDNGTPPCVLTFKTTDNGYTIKNISLHRKSCLMGGDDMASYHSVFVSKDGTLNLLLTKLNK